MAAPGKRADARWHSSMGSTSSEDGAKGERLEGEPCRAPSVHSLFQHVLLPTCLYCCCSYLCCVDFVDVISLFATHCAKFFLRWHYCP